MEDLVIKVKREDISRFIATGQVSDDEVNKIIEETNEFYRVLATLDITYRMPDHLDLVQAFLYQVFDMSPEFPRARKYLDFWEKNLDGPLHSVKIYSTRYNPDGEIRYASYTATLH